jgi:hypothetical protein
MHDGPNRERDGRGERVGDKAKRLRRPAPKSSKRCKLCRRFLFKHEARKRSHTAQAPGSSDIFNQAV